MLGIYVSGHPLDNFADKVSDLATHTTDKLEEVQKGLVISLCGLLTNIQRRTSREGKHWAQMKFDDGRGALDGMVFSTRYEELLPYLKEDAAFL